MQLRYGRSFGYAEQKFWDDRHRRYQSDIRAVGGGSLNESIDRYPKQRIAFLDFLRTHGIDPRATKCVEFGSGNGFWATTMLEFAGVNSYIGFDISETAVNNSAIAVPGAVFFQSNLNRLDNTLSKISADIVFSIDVLQHVTEPIKAKTFLQNMVCVASTGGYVVVTSYSGFGNVLSNYNVRPNLFGRFFRPLPYVAYWDQDFIENCLSGCQFIGSDIFWDKHIFAFKKYV
ncbi:MAG TPA: methyltransferase domain-containing protein [Caulobacteraceae bacterium]|jgi:hypothetical protein